VVSPNVHGELSVSSLLAGGIGKKSGCDLETLERNYYSEKIYKISI